jgi:hypothetical protein
MELFHSVDEPKRYVALKMDYPGKNNILLIGGENGLVNQEVTSCSRFRDGGTTILTTEMGYCFTWGSRLTKRQHTLQMPNGSQRVMVEAADDDPVWFFVPSSEPRAQREPREQKDWTEVDDSILRGWKKDTVLLCDVFPSRSINEIRDRISFLKQ